MRVQGARVQLRGRAIEELHALPRFLGGAARAMSFAGARFENPNSSEMATNDRRKQESGREHPDRKQKHGLLPAGRYTRRNRFCAEYSKRRLNKEPEKQRKMQRPESRFR